MVDIIKSEINKDRPDWLLVSKLAAKLAESTNSTDPLGFKLGYVNFVKETQYSEFFSELKTIANDRYHFISCDYIRKLPRVLADVDLDSKYVILVSYKDLSSALAALGKPVLRFTGSERVRIKGIKGYGDKGFSLRNDNTKEKIVFRKGELVSIMRDRVLSGLLQK